MGEDNDEHSPVKILEQKVEDFKLFSTMCGAVCYVFSMTIVCGHYSFDTEAFTDQSDSAAVHCYATDEND